MSTAPGAAQTQRLSRMVGAVRSPSAAAENIATDPLASATENQWKTVWRNFREHKAAFWSLVVIGTLTLSCIFVPFMLPWNTTEFDTQNIAATGPSMSHLLGTDANGRDVLARLLSAGRVSLLIGLMVALFSATMGAIVGVIAGFYGGKTEERLMWFVTILMTIPSFPLLIAMASVAASPSGGAGQFLQKIPVQWRIIIIMSMLGWMGISRVVRSQVKSLKNQEFVEAARALGASNSRIMVVHILPNTVSVLAVFTTLTVSTALLGESSLSFLGLGVNPPTATWGNMLLEARDIFTAVQYWWLTWCPALAILVSVLCVNFIGDGLRDAFDPKNRR